MEASAQEPTLPSISIGVAASPDDGQSANALLEAADGALYVAKRKHAASVIRIIPGR
jgi:GGDEF domain-containing protein